MSYVVRTFDSEADPETRLEQWHGPFERRWIAETVARKQRKLGREAYILPVDKEVT